ncbi:MAG: DUF3047 domain-containing protein [Deltaproteobacteria bacterium]|nr:DUF3047 domain-containing protein [Deltaproteobacteria bacterium]
MRYLVNEKKNWPWRTGILLLFLLTGILSFGAAGSAQPELKCHDLSFKAGGSEGLPRGWKHFTFRKIKRYTSYRLVKEGSGKYSVKALSQASASALIREIEFDPKNFPVLRWRWKVGNIIKRGEETKKKVIIMQPGSM